MQETFGQFIRRERNEKRLTLTQLAAKLEMDSANLSKVETGKRDFDEKKLLGLAVALDIELPFVKKEYLSDQVAKRLYQDHSFKEILTLAEDKISYYIQCNSKQGELDLK